MTKITIIGAGNMGASLLGGLIANEYSKNDLCITDTDATKLAQIKKQFNIFVTTDNLEAISDADVIILAIKPQILASVAQDLAPLVQKRKPLVISIAAGITEERIQQWLGGHAAIVRAMPNMPSLIKCGASALFANQFVTDAQHNLAETILRSVGIVVWINDENLMHIITPLSGSGPAYYFLIMEAMEKAAIEMGLPPETARILTQQTALGAACMALESDVDVIELRKRVTSPGGTTEQAVRVLEESDLRNIIKEALTAAKIRSEELALS